MLVAKKYAVYALFIINVALIIEGLLFILNPYLFPLIITDKRIVPWEIKGNDTRPKAVIQFTFTSQALFTTNYPINAEVKIWFFEPVKYTNLKIHVLKSSVEYTFKYPLSDPPDAALIDISKTGDPQTGKLDIQFPSTGSYGFYIMGRENGELEVLYVATDKQIIDIKPYETRLGIESNIRMLGIALSSLGIALLNILMSKGKTL
jgi:hypothetical protein